MDDNNHNSLHKFYLNYLQRLKYEEARFIALLFTSKEIFFIF